MSVLAMAQELIAAGNRAKINVELLDANVSSKYIEQLLITFNPFKTTGHLGIVINSLTISLEENEFSFFEFLNSEPAYIFFDQDDPQGKSVVVKIEDAKVAGRVFEDSFGMEYFLSNEQMDYLVAVNWYVIEFAGTAKEKLAHLIS